MYTFRPLEAWNHFVQASTFYQLCLRSVGGPTSDDPNPPDFYRVQRMSRRQRRLEQSLYWSCFKSEVEMRIECKNAFEAITTNDTKLVAPEKPSRRCES